MILKLLYPNTKARQSKITDPKVADGDRTSGLWTARLGRPGGTSKAGPPPSSPKTSLHPARHFWCPISPISNR